MLDPYEPYTKVYCADELYNAYIRLAKLKEQRNKIINKGTFSYIITEALDLADLTKGITRAKQNIEYWADQILKVKD